MILQAPVSRLLRLIIEKQDFAFLADKGIVEDDFQPKTALTAYQWLKDFHTKYEKFPELSTIQDEIKVELPQEVEKEEFILRTFKEYAQGKKIQKIIEDAATCLEARDISAAKTTLRKVLDVESETTFGRSFRKTASERYDRYEEGKLTSKNGISSPWPALTEQIIGYLPASLTTLVAMSNIGKTWLSVIHSGYFLSQGLNVALVSLEDSIELVENRLDSYVYKLNNKNLNKHQLWIRDDTKWREGLKQNVEGEGDIFVYSSKEVKTVSDLAAVVDSSKADVLIVDAAYRLGAKGVEMGWRTSETVVDQLKDLMHEKNIPIILTVQQDPEQVKKKTKHERMYSTRGGKFWGIGSNLVIELTADEDQRLMQTAKLSILKNKNFINDSFNSSGEIDIHWNLLKMEFGELDPAEVIEGIEW